MTTVPARRLGPALAAWGAAVFAAALVGGLATDTTSGWYDALDLPSWQPPGWLFGPVWTILYVLLAVSAALAWRDVQGPRRRLVLGLYGANLVLNAAWTFLFFQSHALWVAFAEILLLLGTILALIALVRPFNGRAAAALAPYAVWVTFAATLNATIAGAN